MAVGQKQQSVNIISHLSSCMMTGSLIGEYRNSYKIIFKKMYLFLVFCKILHVKFIISMIYE